MGNSTDFIIIPRCFFRDESLSDDKFSRREALIDLIQMATHTDERIVRLKGRTITLKRGQVAASVRFLAERWGWSTKKVLRVINDFVNEQRVQHLKDSATSIFTILCYDNFQGSCNTDDYTNDHTNDNTDDNTDDHKINKDNKDNNEKKEKELKEKEIVDRLYAMYPASTYRYDKMRNVSTNKCEKDRTRIRGLLRTHTPEQIEYAITRYVEDTNGQNMKLFATFLNNLPEYEDDKPAAGVQLSLEDELRAEGYQ